MTISSQGSSSAAPSTFVITGNPGVDSAIRSVVMAGVGAAALWISGKLKITDPNMIYVVAGLLFTAALGVLTAAWGVVRSTAIGKIITETRTLGVNAGMNIALKGNAIMVQTDAGTVKPLPASNESAKAIVATYAHVAPELEPEVTDKLNELQATQNR